MRARRHQPARHAAGSRGLPPPIEALETELDIIGREEAIGIDAAPASRGGAEARDGAGASGGLEARWKDEKTLVDRFSSCAASCEQAANRWM